MVYDGDPMKSNHKDLVIIGGGFSGTALAVNLLRYIPWLEIGIVDNGARPGQGVAYSTRNESHLLNVPAENMSAVPQNSDHFLRWARANYDPEVEGSSFLPREVYGRYLESLWKLAASENPGKVLRWRDEAIFLTQKSSHVEVHLKNGAQLRAERVVLATGNFPVLDPQIDGLFPAGAKGVSPAAASKRYVSSAWSKSSGSKSALEGLHPSSSVLLIGSGLTSVDVALALESKGFQGIIHMVSRHGLMPSAHQPADSWFRFWNHGSPKTALGLLRLVRLNVRNAAAVGVDWRGVIDALRPVTQEIWKTLEYAERRRFLRHARSYWEAHRHRIAPQAGAVISKMISSGQLQLHSGRIIRYAETDAGAEVTFRRRADGISQQLVVDRVINCTGPASDYRKVNDPLISSLFIQGLSRPDPMFLGLNVNSDGALLDADGIPSKSLFAIGPATRGFAFETTAVPEIRVQAAQLARLLARALDRSPVMARAAPDAVHASI
jgi:uncharacterized NAD(P)/FAD-binding protein YdhS